MPTAPGEIVGYVVGYASLVHPDDPDVVRILNGRRAVPGTLHGFRRRWTAGMDNTDPANDDRHYLDVDTGERADVVVVFLDVKPGRGAVNSLAIPVDAEGLARLDHRERRYERIEVSSAFEPVDAVAGEALTGQVWTYTARDAAVATSRAGVATGRAVIRRDYHQQVVAAFHSLGPSGWGAYVRSTDPVAIPLRDLRRRGY